MAINQTFVDYYRCPEQFADFTACRLPEREASTGYFRIGSEPISYGSTGASKTTPPQALEDLGPFLAVDRGTGLLPFDLTEVIDNLRLERYSTRENDQGFVKRAIRSAYYFVRPSLPVSVRRHLQRASLKGWDARPFPRWPVDTTVDELFTRSMASSLKAHGVSRIPFVWFWPDDNSSCAIMTHDVETATGLRACPALAALDTSFGIKSSFQIVPEQRYQVREDILSAIRKVGCEINVHDLTHDGKLYDHRAEFLRRAGRINQYVSQFDARGFRSGALYRNLEWYSTYNFSYDMSVPNVGHLDPQPGGCCTVMPYFIGKILELPLTTIQDYSLFHILGDYSTDIWQQQINKIMERHGLVSFIVHPDYLDREKPREIYKELLRRLDHLRAEKALWIPLPGDVDIWWRERAQMTLVPDGDTWRIHGFGSERARLAYAELVDDQVAYSQASGSPLASAVAR